MKGRAARAKGVEGHDVAAPSGGGSSNLTDVGGVTDFGDFTDDELAEERTFLLGSLTDLDAERRVGDVDESDYATLNDGYTVRAAAALREIEARRSRSDEPTGSPATTATPPRAAASRAAASRAAASRAGASRAGTARAGASRRPGVGDGRRRVRVFGVVLTVVILATSAGLFVAGNAGQRLPGQTGSGNVPQGASALLAQAQQLTSNGDLLGALKTYDQVLKDDSTNPEALAYRGWLLRLTGAATCDQQFIDRGYASIQAAIQADPLYPDAHFFAGMVLFADRHDPAAAVTEFKAFLANNPPQQMVSVVQQELQQAQTAAAGLAPGSLSGSAPPVAPVSPPTTAACQPSIAGGATPSTTVNAGGG